MDPLGGRKFATSSESPSIPACSLADLGSARNTSQNSPLRSFGDHCSGCSWACAVQALNV
eukprot:14497652-Alexandrium_andersonii.AAC.1